MPHLGAKYPTELGEMFRNIQALRGVAALLVFVMHIIPHGYGVDDFLYKFWWIGPSGVDLFFVISGFIVCYTAARAGRADEPSYAAAGKFAIKRVVRIFPVYWAVLICAMVVAHKVELSPPDLPSYDTWRYFPLFVMHNKYVMLAWTLAFEMFFYLMLGLIILFRPKDLYRYVALWMVVQAAVVGIASTYRPDGFDNFGWVFTSPLVLEFGMGCLVAFLIDKGVKGMGIEAFISGVLLFSVGCYVNSYFGNWGPAWRPAMFAPGAALIVYGLIDIEERFGFVFPRFMQKLGDASYSIYIWHQLVVSILMKAAVKFGWLAMFPGWLLIVGYGAVALVVGFISYAVIEKPTQNWIHRVLAKPKSAPAATTTA